MTVLGKVTQSTNPGFMNAEIILEGSIGLRTSSGQVYPMDRDKLGTLLQSSQISWTSPDAKNQLLGALGAPGAAPAPAPQQFPPAQPFPTTSPMPLNSDISSNDLGAPPQKKKTTLWIVIGVILALLICCGGGIFGTIWYLNRAAKKVSNSIQNSINNSSSSDSSGGSTAPTEAKFDSGKAEKVVNAYYTAMQKGDFSVAYDSLYKVPLLPDKTQWSEAQRSFDYKVSDFVLTSSFKNLSDYSGSATSDGTFMPLDDVVTVHVSNAYNPKGVDKPHAWLVWNSKTDKYGIVDGIAAYKVDTSSAKASGSVSGKSVYQNNKYVDTTVPTSLSVNRVIYRHDSIVILTEVEWKGEAMPHVTEYGFAALNVDGSPSTAATTIVTKPETTYSWVKNWKTGVNDSFTKTGDLDLLNGWLDWRKPGVLKYQSPATKGSISPEAIFPIVTIN